MRPILALLLLILAAGSTTAAPKILAPAEFEPLTSLPWNEPGATMESVLERIFREPNFAIRYPVLGEYLRKIPGKDIGKAFDHCVELEGMETPDELVAFFLQIWAQRDPQGCWERTKKLFHVCGIEDGWLGYDSWKESRAITVQDLAAIRASPFWLRSVGLKTFPLGVDQSLAPKKLKVKLMAEFTATWLRSFGTWPGYPPKYNRGYVDFTSGMKSAFEIPLEQLRHLDRSSVGNSQSAFEIGMRRWLIDEPASALQVLELSRKTTWPDPGDDSQPRMAGPPSIELFMLWAKADLPGMIHWAESLDLRKSDHGLRVRGFLMSRVDAATRARWLADAKSADVNEDHTEELMADWAAWDPQPALAAAVATGKWELITSAAEQAGYGPWFGQPWNTSCFGMRVFQDFDALKIPTDIRQEATQNWYSVMEQGGDLDIGANARCGLDFILKTNYAPRDRLLRFFSGYDEYPHEDDMIDRTFCSLRVWAVVRPAEMKAWIATLHDAELQKALTWLRQHPWGGKERDNPASKHR